MVHRLSRADRAEHNRGLVLDAARRVFVARGYHQATVDAIAEEAGFSKGVIYSQFSSKAEMFLAILEQRIEQRAAQQLELAERLPGIEDFATLVADVLQTTQSDPAWNLLLIEFRALAARDTELNAQYAALHRRTIGGVADTLRVLYTRSDRPPPAPLELLAAGALAFVYGVVMEERSAAEPLPPRFVIDSLGRLLGVNGSASTGVSQ